MQWYASKILTLRGKILDIHSLKFGGKTLLTLCLKCSGSNGGRNGDQNRLQTGTIWSGVVILEAPMIIMPEKATFEKIQHTALFPIIHVSNNVLHMNRQCCVSIIYTIIYREQQFYKT